MKKAFIRVAICVVGCAAHVALSAEGDQPKTQDRLNTFSATRVQDQAKLKACLPAELGDSVKKMTQAREQYQQRIRDKQQEVAGSTAEVRERLREQLREQIKEQVKDREQIRERLQEMRQLLPDHQELMEQAREQVRTTTGAQTRRGGE